MEFSNSILINWGYISEVSRTLNQNSLTYFSLAYSKEVYNIEFTQSVCCAWALGGKRYSLTALVIGLTWTPAQWGSGTYLDSHWMAIGI